MSVIIDWQFRLCIVRSKVPTAKEMSALLPAMFRIRANMSLRSLLPSHPAYDGRI
jgi:hypothetical protein